MNMTGFVASSCEGELCKKLPEKQRGKAMIVRGLDKKEVCGKCLINGPDFDVSGEIKSV